jgi:hypothetical protein
MLILTHSGRVDIGPSFRARAAGSNPDWGPFSARVLSPAGDEEANNLRAARVIGEAMMRLSQGYVGRSTYEKP